MTKTIKTCLKEDKEDNENQCRALQLIRAELSGSEDGDHEILVSAQGPLVLGFWVFGLRVWGQGLTKTISKKILRLFNVFVRSFYHIANVL